MLLQKLEFAIENKFVCYHTSTTITDYVCVKAKKVFVELDIKCLRTKSTEIDEAFRFSRIRLVRKHLL